MSIPLQHDTFYNLISIDKGCGVLKLKKSRINGRHWGITYIGEHTLIHILLGLRLYWDVNFKDNTSITIKNQTFTIFISIYLEIYNFYI